MFKLGFYWGGREKTVRYTDKCHLYLENSYISYGTDSSYFKMQPHTLINYNKIMKNVWL